MSVLAPTPPERIVDAKGRPYFLWDEDLRGFGVKASASGAKSYLVQYRDGNFGWKADAAGTSRSQPNIEPT